MEWWFSLFRRSKNEDSQAVYDRAKTVPKTNTANYGTVVSFVVGLDYNMGPGKMKLTKVDIDNLARALSDKLLCSPGLKDAKRIVTQAKKNLAAEYKRRKNL